MLNGIKQRLQSVRMHLPLHALLLAALVVLAVLLALRQSVALLGWLMR